MPDVAGSNHRDVWKTGAWLTAVSFLAQTGSAPLSLLKLQGSMSSNSTSCRFCC